MSESGDGADQVDHGEATLGEAQSSNPPVDPEYIEDEAAPLDAEADLDVPASNGERDLDDPAPKAP